MSILIPDWATHVGILRSDGTGFVRLSFFDGRESGYAVWSNDMRSSDYVVTNVEDFMKAHGIAFIKQQIRDKPLSERITPQSKYHKEIKPGVIVDWYDVAAAFSPKPSKMWEKVCGAVHHAHKKLCRLGSGDKELRQDLVEARDSLDRAIQQFDEWA